VPRVGSSVAVRRGSCGFARPGTTLTRWETDSVPMLDTGSVPMLDTNITFGGYHPPDTEYNYPDLMDIYIYILIFVESS
jgi:hypothetical protein